MPTEFREERISTDGIGGLVIHVTATGLIARGGRVLLGKRTSKVRFAGMWDAFGGHLIPCEEPSSALVRELEEELGISALQPRCLGIYEDSDPTPKTRQMNSYRTVRVHPTATDIHGEKAFPSLDAVPIPFDAVHIFRPSSEVPPIVDQAVKSPAKVIWMQLGIRNDEAAKKAQAAGKIVIQDPCMMPDHARPFRKAILE